MAFETTVALKNCKHRYTIADTIKRYTLIDNTFSETKVGNFEFNRLLEEVPNSGKGFRLKIVINKDLSAFKINITDQSGLRLVNIFKDDKYAALQGKFYFLMTSLVERGIFTQEDQ